ncbi:MAG TPA: ATP-binding protein [Xanthobacteraceae bacterium]|nr:ATP-binding protein [Xanthobacteraceae bacterium]
MYVSSLAQRLFLTATAVSIVVLMLIGLFLSTIYRSSIERSFDRRLNVFLKTLVSDVANAPSGTLPEPAALGEPLFDVPLSGWYWQLIRQSGDSTEVKRSKSLPDTGLPRLEQTGTSRPGAQREAYVDGPEGQRLRVIERTVELGDDGRYIVTVAADAFELEDEISDFNDSLFITFGVICLAFVATVWFQVRFGLRPLDRLSNAIAEIRSGRAERLEGAFPQEIAPLAREVNELLESNRVIVERARTHVGNLAHALKTPLSVLRNEATGRDDALADKVRDQVGVMHDQVQRHLERARIVARAALASTVSEVSPVVDGLARTMEKIHHDRALAISARTADGVLFPGEKQDLEEMLGNLVDNACKWANGRVDIEVLAKHDGEANRPFFRVVVDDDGPGLPPEAREAFPGRGRRLDETKPGSGLGLSIVVDLATLYGGKLVLGTAPIGGLRAELVLPAA